MTPARAVLLASSLSAALRRPLRLAVSAGDGEAAIRALGPQPGPRWRRRSHPHRSLTHSGEVAVAAGMADMGVHGLGIDLELRAGIAAAAARFYLTPREAAHAEGRGAGADRERLRLWTVKEAVFKADPANASRSLYDYELAVPGAWAGLAGAATSRLTFEYACVELDGGAGFLSAAVAVPPGELS